MRQLRVTTEFQQQFSRISRRVQLEAKDAAELLCHDPLAPILKPKKLRQVSGNQYRIQLGEYRLIYSFTLKTVLLRTIAHRGTVIPIFGAAMNRPGAIVAIGGGEIGRPGRAAETRSIDQAVVDLMRGKRLLYVPTAGRDNSKYVEILKDVYGRQLGCEVRVLWLYNQRQSAQKTEELINWADGIYVGGGNPIRMLRRWRQFGVDELLTQAHHAGKVLAGISAGAMCWFNYGLTDCWRHTTPPTKTVCRGLNLVPGMFCPHVDTEPHRAAMLKQALKRTGGIGLAFDDCAALMIQGDSFQVLRSKPTAQAQRTFWHHGEYIEEPLPDHGPLALLHKSR